MCLHLFSVCLSVCSSCCLLSVLVLSWKAGFYWAIDKIRLFDFSLHSFLCFHRVRLCLTRFWCFRFFDKKRVFIAFSFGLLYLSVCWGCLLSLCFFPCTALSYPLASVCMSVTLLWLCRALFGLYLGCSVACWFSTWSNTGHLRPFPCPVFNYLSVCGTLYVCWYFVRL